MLLYRSLLMSLIWIIVTYLMEVLYVEFYTPTEFIMGPDYVFCTKNEIAYVISQHVSASKSPHSSPSKMFSQHPDIYILFL